MRDSKKMRKIKVKAPSGRTIISSKRKKPAYSKCRLCGERLNRPKMSVKMLKNLPKTKKRPERPFPELCSRCMRDHFKSKTRG
jgi:large subunit ribosomal protein L34e